MASMQDVQSLVGYTDLVAMPADGRRYEIHGGELVVVPSPLPRRQFAVQAVFLLLHVGLTVAGAAAALGVSRPALSALLNGRADLSGTMALRVEKAFGVRMDTLMRMRASYHVARTRRREDAVRVARYRPETAGR